MSASVPEAADGDEPAADVWSEELSRHILALGVPFALLPRPGGTGAEQANASAGAAQSHGEEPSERLAAPSASAPSDRLLLKLFVPAGLRRALSGSGDRSAASGRASSTETLGVLLLDTATLGVYYAAERADRLGHRLLITYGGNGAVPSSPSKAGGSSAKRAAHAVEEAAAAAEARAAAALAEAPSASSVARAARRLQRAARAVRALHAVTTGRSSPGSAADGDEAQASALATEARVLLARMLLGCSSSAGPPGSALPGSVSIDCQLTATDAGLSIGLQPDAQALAQLSSQGAHGDAEAEAGGLEAHLTALLLAGITSVRLSLSFDALFGSGSDGAAAAASAHLVLPLLATAGALAHLAPASGAAAVQALHAQLDATASGAAVQPSQTKPEAPSERRHIMTQSQSLESLAGGMLSHLVAAGAASAPRIALQQEPRPGSAGGVDLWSAVARCSQVQVHRAAGRSAGLPDTPLVDAASRSGQGGAGSSSGPSGTSSPRKSRATKVSASTPSGVPDKMDVDSNSDTEDEDGGQATKLKAPPQKSADPSPVKAEPTMAPPPVARASPAVSGSTPGSANTSPVKSQAPRSSGAPLAPPPPANSAQAFLDRLTSPRKGPDAGQPRIPPGLARARSPAANGAPASSQSDAVPSSSEPSSQRPGVTAQEERDKQLEEAQRRAQLDAMRAKPNKRMRRPSEEPADGADSATEDEADLAPAPKPVSNARARALKGALSPPPAGVPTRAKIAKGTGKGARERF